MPTPHLPSPHLPAPQSTCSSSTSTLQPAPPSNCSSSICTSKYTYTPSIFSPFTSTPNPPAPHPPINCTPNLPVPPKYTYTPIYLLSTYLNPQSNCILSTCTPSTSIPHPPVPQMSLFLLWGKKGVEGGLTPAADQFSSLVTLLTDPPCQQVGCSP